ncbi:hypothetical protein ASG11_15480 [Sphingomonas sp. Leaf357]|uniref:DUF4143 domain-containing protein n=1 Tax=Sphingomonas sp. Leaf357 TaxID=1736350 RepID=UPI0006F44A95|nr:DUF4143 domain-containing protein [Sphingomonas sp. Leaf357]KQS02180.1 hypothetical protein ASG11_15480 [Sphingomonas sp. Leaf357]
MLILPDIKLVEAHDLLLTEAVGPLLEVGLRESDATSLRFTLNDLRRRGRYLPALLAPTDNRAAAWVGDRLLPELPFFPDDVSWDFSGISVWEELARSHGEWAAGTQKRSRMKQGAFNRLLASGEQQNLLYRLPMWTEPGDADQQKHKLYVTDPGVLHRLLGWDQRTYAHGPLGVGPARVEAFWRLRERSWEGFVVTSITRAAGVRARATVWEGLPGEIDLILEWQRETWAIEVTRGRNKVFRELHGAGHRATSATRPIILVYDDEVGVPLLKGASRLGHRVECMTLMQVLREVMAGP